MQFDYPLTLVKGQKYLKVAQVTSSDSLSALAFVSRLGGQSYLASSWKQPNKRRPISKEYAADLTAKALEDMKR